MLLHQEDSAVAVQSQSRIFTVHDLIHDACQGLITGLSPDQGWLLDCLRH